MSRLLALDQSLRITGYAIFDDNNLIYSGTYSIPSSIPIERRLGKIMQNLNNIAEEYNITEVVLEDIQYQNNKETFKKLAYVQSIIILWCYYHDCTYTIIPAARWRSLLENKYHIKFGKVRAEQKQNAMNFVKSIYPDFIFTEDMADAVCIGLAKQYD